MEHQGSKYLTSTCFCRTREPWI